MLIERATQVGRRFVFGGELELSPELLERASQAMPVAPPPGGVSVCTGRTGLRLALRACVPPQPGAPVLFPSYLCGSLLQAAREEGVPVEFYPINSDLTPDGATLCEMLAARRPRAVVTIDYFGFPRHAGAAVFVAACRRFCPLIEDASHGSWPLPTGGEAGLTGDYVLTSFRKYLPLPDGGWLTARPQGPRLPVLPPLTGDGFLATRLTAKRLRHDALYSGSAGEIPDTQYLQLFAAAERELDRESPLCAMSELSARLLATQDLVEVARRRRANYARLLELFQTDVSLRRLGAPLLRALPTGVSPLAFPIGVTGGRRDALRAALGNRGVYCPIHWALPPEISAERFPAAAHLAGSILSLPCDQRYSPDDMELLASRVVRAWRTCQ